MEEWYFKKRCKLNCSGIQPARRWKVEEGVPNVEFSEGYLNGNELIF